MQLKDFDKEFVERTKTIIQTQCNDKYPYDVTLLLNCLMGLVSLPTERTKINENTFKTACVNKLNDMEVIKKAQMTIKHLERSKMRYHIAVLR